MADPTDAPIVRTSTGAVRGRLQSGVTVFRGIPFAAAPVGERRFQAPQPAAGWDGIREADVDGPVPPQSAPAALPAVKETHSDRHDPNDWLTLNVWTPDPGAADLPVMVWIYGGAYRMGAVGEYDGAQLARRGVVVVMANYRLGMEGFAQIDGAPANRGLLDQVAALRWVQQEISAFGGDPARVTVFGESSGAGSVAALLVMPTAAGLFSRAAAQSVPGTFFTPALATDIATELVSPLNRRPSFEDLADVPPERLTEAIAQLDGRLASIERWGAIAQTPSAFAPVVDGEVMPVDPWTGLSDGASRDVPLVVGHNRDEWRLFLTLDGLAGNVSDEVAASAIRHFVTGADAEARMRAAYPDASAEELYVLAHSDRMFRMPSLQLGEAHCRGGGRAYLYELTWPSPQAGGLLGACHALDIPLVLGVLDAGIALILLGSPPPTEAAEVSADMQRAWTALAADGDPGWPVYESEERLTRLFDVGGRAGVRPYPEEASRRLWADHPIGVSDLQG